MVRHSVICVANIRNGFYVGSAYFTEAKLRNDEPKRPTGARDGYCSMQYLNHAKLDACVTLVQPRDTSFLALETS